MRILATADIHLGSPIRSLALRNPDLSARVVQASRDALVRIIDLAISEQVDVIALAGDLFDTAQPDLRLRAFLIAQLLRAREAGIASVLIRGNHDALLDHGRFGPPGDGIHLLDKADPTVTIKGAAFHGLSFDKAHVARSFLPDYPAPVAGHWNVGLMHTSLGGAEGHDPYAPCSEADLLGHGYDLWCLGHIHMPFERKTVAARAVMPGIPQPRHFGERRGGHVALCTLAAGGAEVAWHAVGRLAFTELRLDLSGAEAEALARLTTALRDERREGLDVAVRLVVTSATLTTGDLTALAQEALEGVEGVFLDKITLRDPPEAQTGTAGDLLRLMQEEIGSDAFHLSRDALLTELRDALPPAIRAELEDTDTLLSEALAEVARRARVAG